MDVYEDRAGVLWVATTGGVFRRGASGTFERSPLGEGSFVISQDAEGHVWAVDQRDGVRRIDAVGTTFGFAARGKGILHDRHGNLWVTTIGQGLFQISPPAGASAARTVRRITTRTGLPNDENSGMLEDREGNIWVGSIGGLMRLTPYKLK